MEDESTQLASSVHDEATMPASSADDEATVLAPSADAVNDEDTLLSAPVDAEADDSGSEASNSLPQDDMQSDVVVKKGRKGLWIALVSVLVVILIGVSVVGAVLYVNRSTPTKTLQAFCTALQKKDAQGLYDQYSKRTKQATSVANISQGLQTLAAYGLSVQSCTIGAPHEDGSKATSTLTLHMKGGQAAPPTTARLQLEDGSWKIDAAPQQSN